MTRDELEQLFYQAHYMKGLKQQVLAEFDRLTGEVAHTHDVVNELAKEICYELKPKAEALDRICELVKNPEKTPSWRGFGLEVIDTCINYLDPQQKPKDEEVLREILLGHGWDMGEPSVKGTIQHILEHFQLKDREP